MTVVTELLPKEFADLEPFAADWCLPSERERFAKRLRQLDGRDAGVLRRHHPARRGRDRRISTSTRSTTCPDGAEPDAPPVLDDHGVVPGRVLAPAAHPRLGRRRARVGRGARAVSETTVLRADRWVDIDAGEVRSPAVIVVEGNRIVGGEPRRAPEHRDRDRSRRRHAPPRPDGHGAEPPHRRPRWPGRPAEPDARRPGRPRLPHVARHGERQNDAAGGIHHGAQPGPDGQDRRLHARRGAHARDRPGLGRRAADHPGRTRHHALRRPPRSAGVPAARARDHAVERGRGHRQRRERGARSASAIRSATARR